MTSNNSINKIKSRLFIALLLICILCTSLFVFTACKKEDETKEDTTTYTYTEDQIEESISNASFSNGTKNLGVKDFPKTSVTGWSRKTETNMTASSAKSGVISTSDAAWDELLNTLVKDSYFLNYYKVKYDFDDADIKEKIKAEKGEDADTSTDAINEYIIKNYFKSSDNNQFSNPGKPTTDSDDKVYMLNNYLTKSKVGLGTAQSITSSSTITMDKGEYGKITVWVKTQNVSGLYNDGDDTTVDYGANIRIKNTFQGSEQADFGIFNIDTKNAWQQFTLYVKSDDIYGCSFSVVLGLGYDKLSATEGTVYFDEVKYETVDKKTYDDAISSGTELKLDYNGENALKVVGKTVALYDMTINFAGTQTATIDLPTTNLEDYINDYTGYTPSNKGVDGKRFDNSNVTATYENDAFKLVLTNASYTLNLTNTTDQLSLDYGQYAYVYFFVKNQLNSFSSTTITVDAFDVYDPDTGIDNNEITKKRAAVATITDVSDEWQKVGVLIKNNFEAPETPDNSSRSFFLSLVVGPTDVAATDYAMDYANGTVLMTIPTITKGHIDEDAAENAGENHELYNFFTETANGTTALYAGSASDFAEETEEEETYALTVAPSDKGTIETKPAIPSGYQGIVANHFYIKEDATNVERDINTSETSGLINTNYLSAYTMLPDVASKLNFTATDDEKSIQPIVIYNKDASHYGYVGASKNIAASAYAKVSVTLRVCDDAKAYVYLVNTDGSTKDVMTFDTFTANVNSRGESIENGTTYENLSLALTVDKSMMENDGWTTVDFYVATGATAKNFRVEVWNGGRDGADASASQGYVFVKNIEVLTAGAFTEPAKWSETFTVSGNPLYEEGIGAFDDENCILYKRVLTATEKQFNEEQTDTSKIVSYSANYVWAKNSNFIYAVYNTIDPVEVDPYASEEEEEETEESGCAAETDPSAFWLSFSSILLGVVLAFAIIMLVIKNVRRRRKANASDAKSHYKVTSRTKLAKDAEKAKKTVKEETDEDTIEEVEEQSEVTEEPVIETEETSTDAVEEEKTLDEYVYGDVQDFGETEEVKSEDATKTEENPENN